MPFGCASGLTSGKLLMRYCLVLVLCSIFHSSRGVAAPLPAGFVYLTDIDPSIELDIRYAQSHNFIGTRIDGYVKPVAIITRETAEALKQVQGDLQRFGLSLKVYDAYRPQRAVDHFVRWAKDCLDQRMKSEFYPNVAKTELFREQYIAAKSGHSRGSTIDITLIYRNSDGSSQELDMGTPFDSFDPGSWPNNLGVNPEQRAHRMLLQTLMTQHGFKPYPKEWWHFTLVNEPFPETYFNFVVE